MFNLVKWAYKLGQQTERKRVAGLLETYPRWQRSPKLIAHDLFGKIEDPEDAETIARIESGIQQGIRDIVDGISRPTNYEQDAYSLLYPKEDK